MQTPPNHYHGGTFHVDLADPLWKLEKALQNIKLQERKKDFTKRVWACDVNPLHGTWKKFYTGTYGALWASMQICGQSKLHLYEILLEDRYKKLYLDIEFCGKLNGTIKVPDVWWAVREVFAEELASMFGVDVKSCDFLVLESKPAPKDKPMKRSAHMILNNRNLAFLEPHLIKAVVKAIVDSPRMTQFMVRNFVGSMTSMIDTAVYGRNRPFR